MAQSNVVGSTVTASAGVNRVSWGQNLTTVVFSLWLMIGLFVDGWAHSNIPELESFFTPWHGIFYSGFLATATWVLWMARRSGQKGIAAIPVGYGMGVIGLILFGSGGFIDMMWHTFLGIEADIPALLSPPHMLLLTGALMIITSPLRAVWLNTDPALDRPTFKQLLPALMSMTLTVSLMAFFLTYEWAFRMFEPMHPMTGGSYQRGIATIYITNAILMLPLFYMMRRWKLPFGTATLMFTLPAVLSGFFDVFKNWEGIPVAFVAGVIVDLLVRKVQQDTAKPWEIRVFAALAALVFWSLFYLACYFKGGISWQFEAWTGSIIQVALINVGFSLIAFPVQLPERLRR